MSERASATGFVWRGAKFEWKEESWPHFYGRPCGAFASVRPCGLRWSATINIGHAPSAGFERDTPQEALEAALGWWRELIAKFDEPTPPPKKPRLKGKR